MDNRKKGTLILTSLLEDLVVLERELDQYPFNKHFLGGHLLGTLLFFSHCS